VVAAAPAPAAAPPPPRARKGVPTQLVVEEPADQRGRSYPISGELTVGRAGGCAISLPDDTFVSSMHARVFRGEREGVLVEDLGSTNGTFLNGTKVTSPVPLGTGDRLKVGNTVLEAR
jgi:pSer/pThr/pTyr-binding forkhead associated (FHA) protein